MQWPHGPRAGEIGRAVLQTTEGTGRMRVAGAVANFTSRHREDRRMTIDPALSMSASGERIARPPVKLGVILLPAMQPQSSSIVEFAT